MIEESDLEDQIKRQILSQTALEFLGRDAADFDWKTNR